eukprot:TRINITY_DN1394_c0_g2_i1.p1 TRINITY_DN1394_c0_g2~~TRINITY_DN1394_c0_g2_i1.p1  ORF type:complete len:234 (+),score=49.63 TRINITY_DN1394_c0_g2_i1:183-884(+)
MGRRRKGKSRRSGEVPTPPPVHAFRRAEHMYKKRKSQADQSTDLSNVIDFRNTQQINDLVYVPAEPEGSNLSSVKVLAIRDVPGFYFFPNALSPSDELKWAKQSLLSYPEHPNVTNLSNLRLLKTQQKGSDVARSSGGDDGDAINISTDEDAMGSVGNGERTTNDDEELRALFRKWCDTANERDASTLSLTSSSSSSSSLLPQLRWTTLGYHYDWTTREYRHDFRAPFPSGAL